MNEISALVTRPAHVPEAAVYEFDMFRDEALLQDPHKRVAELLGTAPHVFWTPHNGGHWVALGHKAIFEASRDWDHFSSQIGGKRDPAAPPENFHLEGRYIPTGVPILLDPPAHTKYRAPLASVFGPKAIKQRGEEIRALAATLLNAVAPQGSCDFITAVAEPLPVQVFLKMMGLPLERQPEFRRMVHEFLSPAPDPIDQLKRYRMVADAIDDVILARKDDRKDDLISLLWGAQIDGQPMTLELMEDYSVLLFIAGLDTVINGIGFGVRHLATHPELQSQLRADPALIPDAVEELLRRYTFTIPPRIVALEVELGGWTMKAGDRLMLYLPAADLDAEQYASPEVFNLARESTTHIAFGAGPHRCLGSHLARLELQILYAELLARLPAFRLDPEKRVTFHAGNIIAIDSLPLRWD